MPLLRVLRWFPICGFYKDARPKTRHSSDNVEYSGVTRLLLSVDQGVVLGVGAGGVRGGVTRGSIARGLAFICGLSTV
jgi:hypothetical protein